MCSGDIFGAVEVEVDVNVVAGLVGAVGWRIELNVVIYEQRRR
jgi:hypothetical protein